MSENDPNSGFFLVHHLSVLRTPHKKSNATSGHSGTVRSFVFRRGQHRAARRSLDQRREPSPRTYSRHARAASIGAYSTNGFALVGLALDSNPLGDAGLAALLPALRQLPPLKVLTLSKTNIGDEGVASLLAQPSAVLKSLEELFLDHNQITDAGCATLASALRGGSLPAINQLELGINPAASQEGRDVLQAALDARSP